MCDIEGFILTGGASSRMGADKARLRLGGQTFVERAARALEAVASEVCVVSARASDAGFGLRLVADVFRGCGALGGIHAALAHSRAPWVAVISCDLPFVTGELMAHLASRRAAGSEAVAPVQPDGRVQPLCALYARAVCRDAAEELLRGGEYRPRALLRRVRTRWVAFDELSDLSGAPLFFTNVNTPDEYARAVEAERG